jgi:hypothetical protein
MTPDLNRIASLLETTMTNAGIMDDYDEVIGDYVDHDPESAKEYHENVLHALEFINDQLGMDYDVSREVSEDNPYTFHMDYLRATGEAE